MESRAPMGEISSKSLNIGDLVVWKERIIDKDFFQTNKTCMGVITRIYVRNIDGRELKLLEIVESSSRKLKKDVSPMIVRVISKVSR